MTKTANEALEEAAQALEQRAGNAVYKQAWKVAAKLVRNLKTKPVDIQR